MKQKFTLVTGILLAAATLSQAQVRGMRDVLVGPVAGFGTTWVNDLSGSNKFMPSGYAGLRIMAHSSQYFAWGGEVTVSSEGYKINHNGSIETERPTYIRVPLQVYYFMGDRYRKIIPVIHFGPSLAAKIAETGSVQNTSKETLALVTPAKFNDYDAGLSAGIGLNVKLGRLTSFNTDLEYYKGWVDAISDPSDNFNRNHSLNISAGLLVRINR